MKLRRLLLVLGAICLMGATRPTTGLKAIERYIKESWTTLSRSHAQLARAARDPKFHEKKPWPVYVSSRVNLAGVKRRLRRELPASDLASIHLLRLPAHGQPKRPGLLYLPYPYVVPGGRFNEMYGWDSHFIVLGLLRDNEVRKALDMVNDQLYEVKYYGKVLNANRSYYLTRSQPPFLATTVLAVYRRTLDKAWLARAVPQLLAYYRYWTTPPHLVRATGLSRYYDLGEGPAPEVLSGERDAQGRTHYDRIRAYYRTHKVKGYDVSMYYDRAHNRLKPLFYKGDRSMRESGFDPSDRFGDFNIDVIHYNPVDLNALLYRYELDMAHIYRLVGRPAQVSHWLARAARRRKLINRYLWDPHDGLYYDYDFQTGKRRRYPFATTFFPLWVAEATPTQAAAVMANLPLFERPGGIVTSTHVSGNQWDAPFGWAPLQLAAVQGMRRYGYQTDADRVSMEFLSLVLQEFDKHHTIVEKYDVEHRTSNVSSQIHYGYSTNVVGFGWTNAVFLRLLDELPPEQRAELR